MIITNKVYIKQHVFFNKSAPQKQSQRENKGQMKPTKEWNSIKSAPETARPVNGCVLEPARRPASLSRPPLTCTQERALTSHLVPSGQQWMWSWQQTAFCSGQQAYPPPGTWQQVAVSAHDFLPSGHSCPRPAERSRRWDCCDLPPAIRSTGAPDSSGSQRRCARLQM